MIPAIDICRAATTLMLKVLRRERALEKSATRVLAPDRRIAALSSSPADVTDRRRFST